MTGRLHGGPLPRLVSPHDRLHSRHEGERLDLLPDLLALPQGFHEPREDGRDPSQQTSETKHLRRDQPRCARGQTIELRHNIDHHAGGIEDVFLSWMPREARERLNEMPDPLF